MPDRLADRMPDRMPERMSDKNVRWDCHGICHGDDHSKTSNFSTDKCSFPVGCSTLSMYQAVCLYVSPSVSMFVCPKVGS